MVDHYVIWSIKQPHLVEEGLIAAVGKKRLIIQVL